MRKPNPREITLLVLLGVVAIVVLIVRDGVGDGSSQAGEEALADIGVAPEVRLARLGLDVESYNPNGRDLFAYGPKPVPKRVAKVLPPPPDPVEIERPKPTVQQRPRAVRNKTPIGPKPPTPSFKYIARFGPVDDIIAVFDDGEDRILARVGEVVKDEFTVNEFGYRSVVLGFTDERFKDKTTELEMPKK